MERNNSGKIIAIVALVVAIAGLSIGFAAFSTRLDIESSADVPVDASVWNVGFSTVNSAITPGTVNGQTSSANNGSLTLTQFTITQNVNATLATTNGSQVDYDFYIVNDGALDAYLNSVTMGNLTCAYNASAANATLDNGHTTVTPGTGTISDADCRALFSATLTIGSDTYNNGDAAITSGFGNTNMLAKPSGTPTYVPAKLVIKYNNDSLSSVTNAPNGDFTVSLSTTSVVYGSTSN